MKTLNVLYQILDKLDQVPIDDEAGFARATYGRVDTLESDDSDNEIFNRRMGIRFYLKQLRVNMVKLHASKIARQASKLKK